MKLLRFAGAVVVTVAAVGGCFGSGSFNQTYTAECSFDYPASEYGKDSVFFSYDLGVQGLLFMGKRDTDNVDDPSGFRGGFLLSMLTDTTYREGHFRSLYSVADTTGAYKSTGFCVWCDKPSATEVPEQSICFIGTAYGTCYPASMMICNTNYTVNTVKFGTEACPAFSKGDWIKVTVTGVLDGVKSGEKAEAYLVNYTENGLSVLTDWKRMDLSKIGDIDYLTIEVSSNRPDAPAYCCIDSFVARISISDE